VALHQFGVITQQRVNSLLYFVLQVKSHGAIHPCVKVLGSVSVHYLHRLSPYYRAVDPGLLLAQLHHTHAHYSASVQAHAAHSRPHFQNLGPMRQALRPDPAH
jgi:hypothetical protein